MNLGRTAIANNGVKYIYPINAFEAVSGEEVYMTWMEGATLCGDTFIVGDVDDITAILTCNSGSDIRVGVQAAGATLQEQCSVVSTDDQTPAPLTDAFLTAFKFTITAVDYVASITGLAVAVTVPFGTVVTALVPVATISNRATVSPSLGVAGNFTTPKTYTVTAEDGTTARAYIVTVTVAPE